MPLKKCGRPLLLGDLDEKVQQYLPLKKCGRLLLLGDLDEKVQQYLEKKVREGGGIVSVGYFLSAAIAIAAARRIVTSCDRSVLAEFSGLVELGRSCACLFVRSDELC